MKILEGLNVEKTNDNKNIHAKILEQNARFLNRAFCSSPLFSPRLLSENRFTLFGRRSRAFLFRLRLNEML